jgi:S1-C subfamily serine protease/photosystem II stability/assembly factor-like uncharacterized protein
MSFRTGMLRAATFVVFGLVVTSSSWSDDPPNRQQQITELEAKIKALTSELEKIKQETKPEDQPTPGLPPSWTSAFTWRSIGPATMGGRITAISVFPSDPSTYWVATASGGLLKTENNGTTFVHQFDKENTVSIGDVCVAPSDKNIVWVGTGEANPRNSVSYGDGVYKSVDGGKTWKHMGLRATYHTGKIAIHPKDPNIVYVGSLGRCYGPNPERGVFKTTNGGETWEKILYFDENTGCIDLMMKPDDPDTLLAALWERKRDGFDSYVGGQPPEGIDGYDPMVKWGRHGGIYRTTDAGKSWKKIDKGVPTVKTGRIGLDWYQKDPNIVFAIIDSENVGKGVLAGQGVYLGVQGEDGDGGAKLTSVTDTAPAGKAGLKVGDVIVQADDKKIEKYEDLQKFIQGKKADDKVTFKVKRGEETKEMTATIERRPAPPGGGGQRGGGGMPSLGFRPEMVEGGLRVPALDKDSEAAKAGLLEGDVVVKIDGKDFSDVRELFQSLSEKSPGDKVKVTVKRGDATKELEVTLAQGGGFGGGGGGGRGLLGFGFRPDPVIEGFKVPALDKESAAAKAGLQEGDVITKIEGKENEDFRELIRSLGDKQAGDKVKVTIRRGNETKELQLTLEQTTFGSRGAASATRPYAEQLFGQRANVQNSQGSEGFQTGGVYKSTDAGQTWTRINSINPRPMYFSVVRVDPTNDQTLYVLGVNLAASFDGGKTFRSYGNRGVHSDQHALWINPKDSRHLLIGTDGGFYVSYDRGNHWEHQALAALGQFYHVALDNKRPYNVYGGLQDNGTWGGPSRSLKGSGATNDDWFNVGGGDGFVCRVDSDDPDIVYGESQDGNVYRRNLRTGEGGSIRPRGRGASNARFNWNTPFILSASNPRIIYIGGDQVYRSVNRGADLKSISPEITRTKRGTATALSESPRNPDVLWVGSDDGALHVTRDGGKTWENVYDKLGAPEGRWVATIEASRFVDGRAYVCLDAHRSDDDKPYLFVTEDFGKTWKNITNNLPAFGSSRCLREDLYNKDLLLCGTEFGVFASVDRGAYWTKINNNLPTVAVHELAIHPTAGEVVAATHGRSLWAMDITPLRQIKADIVKAPAHVFAPAVATKWRLEPSRNMGGFGGSKKYMGQNPLPGTGIYYSITGKPEKASLKILDYAGQVVRELPVKKEPGLHKAQWDLSRPSVRGIMGAQAGNVLPEELLRRPGGLFGQAVPPGTYRVVLNVDGKEISQPVVVEADPNTVIGAIAVGGDDDDEEKPWEKNEEEEKDPDDDD